MSLEIELPFRKQDGTCTTTHVHIIYDSVYLATHYLTQDDGIGDCLLCTSSPIYTNTWGYNANVSSVNLMKRQLSAYLMQYAGQWAQVEG